MLKIYNRKEFIDRIQHVDEVILFGAGKKIYDVEKFFSNTNVSAKICKVLDNDTYKQGTIINLWGKGLKILSLNQIIPDDSIKRIILITLEDYGLLLDDLLSDMIFDDIEIVCFAHIMALEKESKSIHKTLPNEIRLEKKPLIPKKIHYCWFGGKEIPDKYKRYMESWHKFCPDYEIIQWNESNYDISKCKYMQEAYEKNVWGFVPDYARLDIVYNNGGIYLDTDVELVKNIDDLLYQKGFAGFEDESYVALGLGFGAMRHLPILREMMDYYEKESFIKEDGSLNLIESPIHNTEVLLKKGLVCNGDYQKVADMTIYPAKVLSGKCMYTMRTVIKPWTYAIHHYDGSWATEKARRMNARMGKDMMMYHSDSHLGESLK